MKKKLGLNHEKLQELSLDYNGKEWGHLTCGEKYLLIMMGSTIAEEV